MLDHLTATRHQPVRRTVAGVAVSVGLHAALIALLAYGVGTAAGGGGREAGSGAVPGSAASGGRDGIGGTAVVSRLSIPPLDLRAAELAPAAPRLPDTLELGRAVPIRFLLPPQRIAPDSVLRVETASGAPVALQLSRTRQATLQGTGFVVEPLTPELQVTNEVRPTEWLWRVTPTVAGTQSLSLRLHAVATVGNRERVVTLASLPGEVVVQATAIQRASRFFSHHWTWLSLLTLVALFGWLRAVIERRRGV